MKNKKNGVTINLTENDIQRIIKKVVNEQADTTEDDIERLSDRAEELELQARQLEYDINNYIDDLEMEITEFQSHHEEDDGNLTEAVERAYHAAADADKSGDELDMVSYFLESYRDNPGNYWSNTGPREINEANRRVLGEQVSDLQNEFMNGPVTEFCKKWNTNITSTTDCEYKSPCYDILIAMRKMKKQGCNPIIPEYRKDGEPQ